jgi:hypothetical protein
MKRTPMTPRVSYPPLVMLVTLVAFRVAAFPMVAAQDAHDREKPAASAAPASAATTTVAATMTTTFGTEPAPAVTDQRRVMRVAVRDLVVGDSQDERLGRFLTEAFVVELRKLVRVSVTSMQEVRALMNFEADRQLVGCSEGSCIAEIVEALGVDLLLVGQLERLGNERLLLVRVLDQQQGRAVAEFSRRLAVVADGEEVLAMVGPAIKALFPDVPVRAGVTRGVDARVAVRLHPPPLSPWVPWTGLVVTAVLGAGAVGAGVVNVSSYQEGAVGLEKANAATPVDGAAFVKQQRTVETSFAAFAGLGAGAVIVGACSIVAALWTNWTGESTSLE